MTAKGENRERELMDAAIQLFRLKGYHATSIRDLAEAVGVRKSALYHYVTSKEDLLFRLSYGTFQESCTVLREVLQAPISGVERLRRAITHHVTYVANRGAATTVALRDAHALAPDYREQIQQTAREYMALWEEILRRGVDAGEFRSMDLRMTVLTILGAGNWMATWYRSSGRLTQEQIAAVFIDVFLTGLIAPPSGVPRGHIATAGTIAFRSETTVRWGDVDASGRLPAAGLLRLCEAVVDEFLQELGWGRARLQSAAGITLHPARTLADCYEGAREGDVLAIQVAVAALTERSLALQVTLARAGATVARADLVLEAQDARSGVALPLPLDLYTLLAPFATA